MGRLGTSSLKSLLLGWFILGTAGCGDWIEGLLLEKLTAHQSGREHCEALRKKGETSREYSRRIEVQALDAQGATATTEIYTWTYEPFDASKPTAIFLQGGPGGTSRGLHFPIRDLNFIYFDQRGVGCSQPETLALHRNPDFFTSRMTAMDVEAIRRAYGVDKISVYGSSYGTVPATMYAALFPEHTQAVVLEGTIFGVHENYWRSPVVLRIAQGVFNRLSPEEKAMVLALSQRDPYAFGDVVTSLMYFDDMEADLKDLLRDLSQGDKESDGSNDSSEDMQGIFLQAFRMINCQEFAMGSAQSAAIRLDQNGVLSYSDSKERSPSFFCKGLPITEDKRKKREYFSTRYPIHVPITYFQGARDGATPGGDAVRHYKQTAQANRQILIMPLGGHSPNAHRVGVWIDGVARPNRQSPSPEKIIDGEFMANLQREIFRQALLGEPVRAELIDLFNRISSNPWRYAKRWESQMGMPVEITGEDTL